MSGGYKVTECRAKIFVYGNQIWKQPLRFQSQHLCLHMFCPYFIIKIYYKMHTIQAGIPMQISLYDASAFYFNLI